MEKWGVRVVRKLGSPKEGRRGRSESTDFYEPQTARLRPHLGKGGKTPERDGGGVTGDEDSTASEQGTEAAGRATQACSWQDMMR